MVPFCAKATPADSRGTVPTTTASKVFMIVLRKNKNAFEREDCAHARVHAGDTARRFGTVT
jgi:hypothetical protein